MSKICVVLCETNIFWNRPPKTEYDYVDSIEELRLVINNLKEPGDSPVSESIMIWAPFIEIYFT